jgi:hypothetical protein
VERAIAERHDVILRMGRPVKPQIVAVILMMSVSAASASPQAELALGQCIQANAPLLDDLTSPANTVALAVSVLCDKQLIDLARDRLNSSFMGDAARRLDLDMAARGQALASVRVSETNAMTLYVLQHRVCRRLDLDRAVKPPSCAPFAAGSSSASRP